LVRVTATKALCLFCMILNRQMFVQSDLVVVAVLVHGTVTQYQLLEILEGHLTEVVMGVLPPLHHFPQLGTVAAIATEALFLAAVAVRVETQVVLPQALVAQLLLLEHL